MRTVYLLQTHGEFLHPHNRWDQSTFGAVQFDSKEAAAAYMATIKNRGPVYLFPQAVP
jgi:hypothetical protein